MKLTLPDLEPHFLTRIERFRYKHTDDIAASEGLSFLCPACFWSNNGKVGTHRIIVWRPSVPRDDERPGPGRWDFAGTGYADMTLTAASASVAIIGGCRAHFYIRQGKVDFC